MWGRFGDDALKSTRPLIVGAAAVAGLSFLAASYTPADAGIESGINGPDVTASQIGIDAPDNHNFAYYGTQNGIRAYSMASTSCNTQWGSNPAPDVQAVWNPPLNNPVISQALYRMNNAKTRFEQIGLSWVKWSFCAADESGCGPCQNSGTCDTLGIGCADTYWATLNASTQYCGPRWEINPQGQGPGQVHDSSHVSPGNSYNACMWVKETDFTAGSRYFGEIQYICHDEQLERRWNNASYREVFFNLFDATMTGAAGGQDSVYRGWSALHAWKDNNPDVEIAYVEDDPGAGRFEIACLVTENKDGTWNYEYAVHNLNSHRAARGFEVPMPAGANITNVQFRDVQHAYHHNDGWGGTQNFDNTDWPVTVGPNNVSWLTSAFNTDPNANALRWGTTYNYRFRANAAPVKGNAVITMYRDRAGGRPTVEVSTLIPEGIPAPICPADLTGSGGTPDGMVDVNDLFLLLAGFGADGPGADLAPATNVIDVNDLFVLLAAFGTCP